MRVVEPFGFLDGDGQRWPVPVGTDVDGASIPQPLWSLIGGPWEGEYRDASVIHDYYCDTRIKSWKAVHRVFYNAMCASGVSELRAKTMYAAVYFCGPHWSDTTTHNANLPRTDYRNILFSVHHSDFELGVFEAVGMAGESAAAFLLSGKAAYSDERGETRLDFDQMESLIAHDQPSLAEIDKAIDDTVEILERPWECPSRTVVVPKS